MELSAGDKPLDGDSGDKGKPFEVNGGDSGDPSNGFCGLVLLGAKEGMSVSVII